MSFITFEVLILVIVLHMPTSVSLVGLVVIFHMVSAEALGPVSEVNAVVRDEKAALAALRSGGGQFSDAAL